MPKQRKLQSISHAPSLYRVVVDTHTPHDDCLIDLVSTKIPEIYKSAWELGLKWLPKTDGWTQTFEHAYETVKQGIRPLLYGWTHTQITSTNLNVLNMGWISVGFLPQNQKLAELMNWGHEQLDHNVHHIINGVVLGYPLDAIEWWVLSGCPGPTMREVLSLQI